jgi:hypothetical protein
MTSDPRPSQICGKLPAMTSGSGKPLDLLPQMERLTGSIQAIKVAEDTVAAIAKALEKAKKNAP